MSTIVTRAGKGSPLTHTEVDNNFTNLNTDKAEDSTVVKLSGDQTIGGTKTFSSTITGSISGNAGTATNGVVTTGSYADPSWITSLDDGKVLPSMSGNTGKFLTTNGTDSSWADVSGSISVTGGDLTLSGSTGTAITNATLATVNSNVGSYGSSTAIPVVTVNAKGLITGVTTATVAGGQYFGSAAVKAIAYNSQTIAENVTVTAGNNGGSFGAITINSGFTVTIESGSTWVIV
jgi:hypothetical protein